MTLGRTFLRWSIYLQHLWASTLSQNRDIPSTSSSLFVGFTVQRIYSFSSCQRFSIGFMSGDSGGVRHQLMFFEEKNSLATRDVCFGSLSCIKRYELGGGNVSYINGTSVCSRMSQYSGAVMILSKMHTAVAPFLLIPPHTWTLTGCLARGFGRGFSPCFL